LRLFLPKSPFYLFWNPFRTHGTSAAPLEPNGSVRCCSEEILKQQRNFVIGVLESGGVLLLQIRSIAGKVFALFSFINFHGKRMHGGGTVVAALNAVDDFDDDDFRRLEAEPSGLFATGGKLDPNAPREPGSLYKESRNGEVDVLPGKVIVENIHEQLVQNQENKSNYCKLLFFLLYVVLYIGIIGMQRAPGVSFQVEEAIKTALFSERTNTLEWSSGEITINMDSISHIWQWFEATIVDGIFLDPVCGDGICDIPLEYRQWESYGCSDDCGFYPRSLMVRINVEVTAEFEDIEELNFGKWNLCSVTHDLCYFETFQKFSTMNETQHINAFLPEGVWEIRLEALRGGISGRVYNSSIQLVDVFLNSTSTTSNFSNSANNTAEFITELVTVEQILVSWTKCKESAGGTSNPDFEIILREVLDECIAATGIQKEFCAADNCKACLVEQTCKQQQTCDWEGTFCFEEICSSEDYVQCFYCFAQTECDAQPGCAFDFVSQECKPICDAADCFSPQCQDIQRCTVDSAGACKWNFNQDRCEVSVPCDMDCNLCIDPLACFNSAFSGACFWDNSVNLCRRSDITCSNTCGECINAGECSGNPNCQWNTDHCANAPPSCNNDCSLCPDQTMCSSSAIGCLWDPAGSVCIFQTCSDSCRKCDQNGCVARQLCNWKPTLQECQDDPCMHGCSQCGNAGKCNANALCEWSGTNCIDHPCQTDCSACDQVQCPMGAECEWDGTACDTRCNIDCRDCSDSGTCIGSTLGCAWDGMDCREKLCENICEECSNNGKCSNEGPGCVWNSATCENPGCSSSCNLCGASGTCNSNPSCTWIGTHCESKCLTSCSECGDSFSCLNDGPSCTWDESSCNVLTCADICGACPESGSCSTNSDCVWMSGQGCIHGCEIDCSKCTDFFDCKESKADCDWMGSTSYFSGYSGSAASCMPASCGTNCTRCATDSECFGFGPDCVYDYSNSICEDAQCGNSCYHCQTNTACNSRPSECQWKPGSPGYCEEKECFNFCPNCLDENACDTAPPGCFWDGSVCKHANCSNMCSLCPTEPDCDTNSNCNFNTGMGQCEDLRRVLRRALVEDECSLSSPCNACHNDEGLCNTKLKCEFDRNNYECVEIEVKVVPETCIEESNGQCDYAKLFNKLCDTPCNIRECQFDDGNCPNTANLLGYLCSPGCYCDMLSDGECNPECNNLDCGRDLGDCCERTFMTSHRVTFEIWNRFTPDTIERLTPDPAIPRKRYLATANRIVGGVLLMQERYQRGECSNSSRFPGFSSCCATGKLSKDPFGADPVFLKNSTLNTDPLIYDSKQLYYNLSDPSQVSPLELPYGFRHFESRELEIMSGFPVYLDVNLGNARAKQMLNYMREGFFLDSESSKLNVFVVTYNADFKTFANTKMTFTFELGGRISMVYLVQTFRVESYDSSEDDLRYIMELTFVALTGINVLLEIWDWFRAWIRTGSPLAYFASFWNCVDASNIFLFTLNMYVWWDFYATKALQYSPKERYEVYKDLNAKGNFLDENEDGMREMLSFFELTGSMSDQMLRYMGINGAALIFVVLRVLKVLDFQKRMGLVTRTISNAATDLAHFAVLFGMIFSCYACLAFIIFGSSIIGFSTLPRAFNTCFSILLGEITVVGELFHHPSIWSAILFYYSFIFLAYFILMNILLAILVEAFVEVKKAAEFSYSLPEEILRIFTSSLRSLPWFQVGNDAHLSDTRIIELTRDWVAENHLLDHEHSIGHRTFRTEGFEANTTQLKEILKMELKRVRKKKEKVKQGSGIAQAMGHKATSPLNHLLESGEQLDELAERIAVNVMHRYGHGREVVHDASRRRSVVPTGFHRPTMRKAPTKYREFVKTKSTKPDLKVPSPPSPRNDENQVKDDISDLVQAIQD